MSLVSTVFFKVNRTVCTFWETYGVGLQSESGPGTFKYSMVVKMGELHEYIADQRDKDTVHRKILDIVGEQTRHMIQFQSCLDEFNRYLGALRALDMCMQHDICK